MNITEAMRAVDEEYSAECVRAQKDAGFGALLAECVYTEYDEIDRELPDYVTEIARTMGAQPGSTLPPMYYQMARMCFRLGMRCQRKIDRPEEPSSVFWRSDQQRV